MMRTEHIYSVVTISLFLTSCLANDYDLAMASYEEDIIENVNSNTEEENATRAPGGWTDYSYYNAIDVCQPWSSATTNAYISHNYIENRHASMLGIRCVLPAIYYNDAGYSSDDISEIAIFGRNRNDVYPNNFTVTMYSRRTTDTTSTSNGTRYISYDAEGDMSVCYFSQPGIPWIHPYIILDIWIPGSDSGNYSGLYNFRVYHEEEDLL